MFPDLSRLELNTPTSADQQEAAKRPRLSEETPMEDSGDEDSQATEVDPPMPDSQATEVDPPEYQEMVDALLRRVEASRGVSDPAILGSLLRECERLLVEIRAARFPDEEGRLEAQVRELYDLLDRAVNGWMHGLQRQIAERVAVQPPTQDNPSRRTRHAEDREAALRGALQNASRVISAFDSSEQARREMLEAALASLQQFSESRAASMRVILQAELARLAVLRGDEQAGALREDALQRELEEARIERGRRVRAGDETYSEGGSDEEAGEQEEAPLPEGEYHAKALLDRLATKNGVLYFVEWQDFPVGTDAWQNEERISADLKQDFETRHGLLVDDDITRVVRLLPREHVVVEARRGRNAKLRESDLLENATALLAAFRRGQRDRQRQQGTVGNNRPPEAPEARPQAASDVHKLLVWDVRSNPPVTQ